MKHPEHICRFNDSPQSCECYDTGYERGRAEMAYDPTSDRDVEKN